MQSEVDLDLIRQYDPDALRLIAEDLGGYYLAKRVLDILVASILLIFLSPLMLLIALSIKIYSRGPIFFVQERVGSKRRTEAKNHIGQELLFLVISFALCTLMPIHQFIRPISRP